MIDPFEDHCWQDVVDPELLEIYSAYRRDLTIGPRPAVLAIDLYNVVYSGGPRPVREVIREYPSSCGEHAWAAIEPTRALFAAARASGIPIIYSTDDVRPEVRPKRVSATFRKRRTLDPEAFRIKEEFRPEPDDLIVYKQRASALFGTSLVAHLVAMGVDTLLICGESTSGCVRASTVDAFSYGFHPVLVEECCFDRSLLSHKVNLFDLHHKYADVMHVDEVLQRVRQR